MSDISIHNVQKIEVVKVYENTCGDGKPFYVARLEITSKRYVSDLELSEFDKKHFLKKKGARLSGEVNVITKLSLFADNKEALEVKLNAFKEDK